MDSTDRLKRITTLAAEIGIDALALVPGPDLDYLTGLPFHMSERPIMLIVPVDGQPGIVVPEFESGKVQSAGYRVFTYGDEEGHTLAFHEACAALELAEARVGVEELRMRYLEARLLERYAPGIELVAAGELFSQLRMEKDEDEIARMRRAIAIAEEAFLGWLRELRVGMTEREAAARLIAALLRGGAEDLAFAPIVAGGPNGGLPHATPGDRPFAAGDWVVVDWGAKVDSYMSDLTRMVVFGEPQGVLLAVNDIVLRANRAGRAVIQPGVTAGTVDAAARAVIVAAGYGPQFTHRTGHGLGLESHEPPYIVGGSTLELTSGMTFTVEPGIYLPEVGGVRIEDNVLVTRNGSETLTTLSRSPFVVPVDRTLP